MATEGKSEGVTLYEAVGGMSFFEGLVEVFYRHVQEDPVLLTLYPEADLNPAKRRLALFLAQYWGGPTTYLAERGHPALRMRHFPFSIGPRERDHWLDAMRAAVAEMNPAPPAQQMLMDYFTGAAEHLRNDQQLGLREPPAGSASGSA
jgi:hemoglobin